MPRGIPKARSDETALRYTTFHVPLPPNPKYMASAYLKADSNSHWVRKGLRRKDKDNVAETGAGAYTRRGSNVFVIHPGSSFLRVGRATDSAPVAIPSVVARRLRNPSENATFGVHAPDYIQAVTEPKHMAGGETEQKNAEPSKQEGRVTRKSRGKAGGKKTGDEDADDASSKNTYEVKLDSDDPFDQKLAALQISLRDRMRFYKLAVEPQGSQIAATFNHTRAPDVVPENDDPEYLRVKESLRTKDTLIGEEALILASMANLTSAYSLRRPLVGYNFNTRDYSPSSVSTLFADVQALVDYALYEKLRVTPSAAEIASCGVVLVVPDFWDRTWVREWVQMLLTGVGFGKVTIIQESLAATYGAGISSACVVDVGAVCTSVSCVDDGLVLQDTRMQLFMGGNDITEFLYVLLKRIGFPYRDAKLARSYDWEVLDDLKKRMCTLTEADVALNLYDFTVRRPGMPSEKYQLRAYDENILAPMCIFEPRVIEFDHKKLGFRPLAHPDITEEIVDVPGDRVTQAMLISTQHLLPQVLPPIQVEPQLLPTPSAELAFDADPIATMAVSAEPMSGAVTPRDGDSTMDVDIEGVPMEALDKPTAPLAAAAPAEAIAPPRASSADAAPMFSDEIGIDVVFEAAKLPLDVAIFNSARAAGGDDKIRKYLQAILVVGGGSLIPGMAHALESRLQAIATPLVPNMEKVQIIPPPKGVDPANLVWKGGSILAKMEGVSDLWITAEDWDLFGMRGLRERCFYL